MPNDNGTDLAVVLAQEIAKQLPVKDIYVDVAQPATKQAGGFLEDLVKCLRLALVPLQIGAVYQDRLRAFIDNSAGRVPADRRISPAPQIIGPIIEAIRYEPEGTITDEAFSELLSRAFDRERAGQVHPSFPSLIRMMSGDEIILIKKLWDEKLTVAIRFEKNSLGDEVMERGPASYAQEFPFLSTPGHMRAYAEHLQAIGIIAPLILIASDEVEKFGPFQGYRAMNWVLRLTSFGELFAAATNRN